MADLNKEIWLPELMEGFYGDDMFLSEARDMSAFVDNDKINLAEAGVNPDVLVNNSTYPIAISSRTDAAIALSLDTYDTKNTRLRSIETAELAYDKRTSVLYGHKMALKMKFMEKAIHAFAPGSDTDNTPVIASTGAVEGGVKSLTFADLLSLENKFNEAEIPPEGRVLVLGATHKTQLQKQDIKLYKDIFSSGSSYAGFKIYTLADKRMPLYVKTSGARVAYGTTKGTTHTNSSVAFHKDEVMRCQGSVDMFIDLKNPKERADILGFQMRALASPIRTKGLGAIYSPA